MVSNTTEDGLSSGLKRLGFLLGYDCRDSVRQFLKQHPDCPVYRYPGGANGERPSYKFNEAEVIAWRKANFLTVQKLMRVEE